MLHMIQAFSFSIRLLNGQRPSVIIVYLHDTCNIFYSCLLVWNWCQYHSRQSSIVTPKNVLMSIPSMHVHAIIHCAGCSFAASTTVPTNVARVKPTAIAVTFILVSFFIFVSILCKRVSPLAGECYKLINAICRACCSTNDTYLLRASL